MTQLSDLVMLVLKCLAMCVAGTRVVQGGFGWHSHTGQLCATVKPLPHH